MLAMEGVAVPINRLLLGSVSLAALGMSQAALADETDGQAPRDWSGPYVGGNIGGAVLDNNVDINIVNIPGNPTEQGDAGITGGVQIGWNAQHDQFVFGIEGDFNFLNVEDDTLFQTKTPNVLETEFDWFASIRGRAGVAVDQTLLYVTLGLAIAEAEISTAGFSNSKTLLGLAAGGGVEHWFTDNLSGKIEYLYADMERLGLGSGIPIFSNPHLHIVRAGINYHFCWAAGC